MAISIAMVAMDASGRISGDGILKAWRARWPKSPQPEDAEQKENTLAFRVGDWQVIYALMPAPIPWGDLEAPCATSPFWPEAAEQMKQHQRHVIVTVLGEGEAVERMLALTQSTVALVDACQGSVGVYWCPSALILPPKKFCSIATQFLPGSWPLPIWIDFRVMKAPKGSAGFTRGLAAFDLLEFEARSSPEPPEELRERLLGLAAYVLEQGPVINDGDTVGEDAKERIKAVVRPSAFGNEGSVLRLVYPKEGKKSGGPKGKTSGGLRLTAYGWVHAIGTLLCTIAAGVYLYREFPFLRDSFLRHVLLVPATAIFGFVLLLVSDRLLQQTFGLEAFDKSEN